MESRKTRLRAARLKQIPEAASKHPPKERNNRPINFVLPTILPPSQHSLGFSNKCTIRHSHHPYITYNAIALTAWSTSLFPTPPSIPSQSFPPHSHSVRKYKRICRSPALCCVCNTRNPAAFMRDASRRTGLGAIHGLRPTPRHASSAVPKGSRWKKIRWRKPNRGGVHEKIMPALWLPGKKKKPWICFRGHIPP